MAEPSWFEVTAVLRTTPELLAKARQAIEGSDLVDVDTWEVLELDEHRCRWDGSSPSSHSDEEAPATRVIGMPEPASSGHPVFDGLRRGLHLHEQ